jgi:hypothetical protein
MVTEPVPMHAARNAVNGAASRRNPSVPCLEGGAGLATARCIRVHPF